MSSAITQRLRIEPMLSYEELVQEIEKGGRFIMYRYTISLGALTLKRFSPAHFVRHDEPATKYKGKYNMLTNIFGWWGIPWGIPRSIESIKFNNKGGLDITNDILKNLTAKNYDGQSVIYETMDLYFGEPDRDEEKAFRKALEPIFERDQTITTVVVGLYLNVEYGPPPYMIGIELSEERNKEELLKTMKKAFYKRFNRSAHMEFFDIDREDEMSQAFLEQGLILKGSKEN